MSLTTAVSQPSASLASGSSSSSTTGCTMARMAAAFPAAADAEAESPKSHGQPPATSERWREGSPSTESRPVSSPPAVAAISLAREATSIAALRDNSPRTRRGMPPRPPPQPTAAVVLLAGSVGW
jgi:hypothetical protein